MKCARCNRKLKNPQKYGAQYYGSTCIKLFLSIDKTTKVNKATDESNTQLELDYGAQE